MKYGVFISYSHHDAELIDPVVKIIRTMRNDRVFQDKDDIKPGQPWEIQLTDALEDAKMVVVFWCNHSAASEYVRKEYLRAIETKKKVLPVVLDESEMDKELAAYQWIDLKDVITHGFTRADLKAFMELRNNSFPIHSDDVFYDRPYRIDTSHKRKRFLKKLRKSILSTRGSMLIFLTLFFYTAYRYARDSSASFFGFKIGHSIIYLLCSIWVILLIIFIISLLDDYIGLKVRVIKETDPSEAHDNIGAHLQSTRLVTDQDDEKTIKAAQIIIDKIKEQIKSDNASGII